MRRPRTPKDRIDNLAAQVEVLDKIIDLIDKGSDPRQTCVAFRNNAAYIYSTANDGKHGVIKSRR